MRLAKKVSLITGAGAGMGYAAAHLFAREGSAIAIVDVDRTSGMAVAQSVRATGGNAEFFGCDITDPAAVERISRNIPVQQVRSSGWQGPRRDRDSFRRRRRLDRDVARRVSSDSLALEPARGRVR
jgi:hypothetical protein